MKCHYVGNNLDSLSYDLKFNSLLCWVFFNSDGSQLDNPNLTSAFHNVFSKDVSPYKCHRKREFLELNRLVGYASYYFPKQTFFIPVKKVSKDFLCLEQDTLRKVFFIWRNLNHSVFLENLCSGKFIKN